MVLFLDCFLVTAVFYSDNDRSQDFCDTLLLRGAGKHLSNICNSD